jgi:hypothetical protein
MDRSIFYDKWYMICLRFEAGLVNKGWKYIGAGKNRRVWQRKNVVLKIAYVESGIIANQNEYKLYHQFLANPQEIKLAPCRLVADNVLMMRSVKIIDDDCYSHLIPRWSLELNDGPQVGFDKSGTVLAYDYAEEI